MHERMHTKYIFPVTHLPHLWLTSFFCSRMKEQFSQVLDAMFELIVKPQEHVIDQGHDGDNFYVIER